MIEKIEGEARLLTTPVSLLPRPQVSKVPIICICNDAWHSKLRSLKDTHCLHLAFHKPTKQQIRTRMVEVAAAEGLQVNDNAMEALVESCKGDIRLVLNTLQASGWGAHWASTGWPIETQLTRLTFRRCVA